MRHISFAALTVAVSLAASTAFSATVGTFATVEINDTGVTVATDSDSNVDTPSIAGATGVDADRAFAGPDFALALQAEDGTSALASSAFVASGQQPAQYIAEARQVITETNTSGGDLSYALDYALTDMSFYLNGDFGGANSGPNPFLGGPVESVGVRFSYEVLLNGGSIFTAGIEAFGGGNDTYQLDNANNASATLNINPGFGGFCCDGADVLIDDIIGSLDLGTFSDGEVFSVETVLRAESLLNGFENVAEFFIGDPTSLTLNAGSLVQRTSSPPPIPLPAGAWLMLAGLGALGAVRAKRKA